MKMGNRPSRLGWLSITSSTYSRKTHQVRAEMGGTVPGHSGPAPHLLCLGPVFVIACEFGEVLELELEGPDRALSQAHMSFDAD
jgi:hypothetical protein